MIWYAQLLREILADRIRAVRQRPGESDRGASALEWAIIAGVSVVLAALVGGIVYHIVSRNTANLAACGAQQVGDNTSCAPGK